MSYELVTNGELGGQFASSLGFAEMARYCETRGDELKNFFETGVSRNAVAVRTELRDALSGAPNEVRSSILRFLDLIEAARDDDEISFAGG